MAVERNFSDFVSGGSRFLECLPLLQPGGALLAPFFCIFLILLPLCATAADKQSESIKLGMSAAFTGPSKGLGIELYRGSMAWFQHINQNGGVHGRKIEILAKDDGYDPTPAIENTLEFVDAGALALFNYVGTPTVARVLPLLKLFNKRKIYLFFPFTGAQPQREPPYNQYVFNLRASYRQETEGLIRHFQKLGRKRIAVLYQADAYGRSGWDGVRRSLALYASDIVAEATYARGASFYTSMVDQVNIIAKASPDAIILVGAYAACAAFIRDARDAGIDVPIANLSFVGSENLLHLLIAIGAKNKKDYTNNLINTQVVPSYEDMSLPAVREYRKFMDQLEPSPPQEFDKHGYSSLQYSFVSFEGFLNAKVITAVLERMGKNPSRDKIEQAVMSIDDLDIGLDETVKFSAERHQGLHVIYYTTVADKAFVPITDWSVWKR